MAKQKYYVVWKGRNTGIFTDWPTTQASVAGFKGAKHKSFESRAEAGEAFGSTPVRTNVPPPAATKRKAKKKTASASSFVLGSSFDIHIFCDGGCNPNPGKSGSGVVV